MTDPSNLPATSRIRVVDITECLIFLTVDEGGRMSFVSPLEPGDAIRLLEETVEAAKRNDPTFARPE